MSSPVHLKEDPNLSTASSLHRKGPRLWYARCVYIVGIQKAAIILFVSQVVSESNEIKYYTTSNQGWLIVHTTQYYDTFRVSIPTTKS
jgi:hypothetical protein